MKDLTMNEMMSIDGGMTPIEWTAVVLTVAEWGSEVVTGKPASKHVHEALESYDPGGSTWGINGY
ncbi:hypothetical protein [Fusibacter sp. JL216-2]|uniref:hypothetical protein n=1 Tax=Fusibacter sp. JL216-2 TaxID=3071453 RepID=UPI003D330720